MELDLELGVEVGRAGVNLWEEHVERDLHVRNDVSIGDLDILNFRGGNLAFKGLNSYELGFYRFNVQLGVLADEVAVERLVEITIDCGNFSFKLELRDRLTSLGLDHFWRNLEVLGNFLVALNWI